MKGERFTVLLAARPPGEPEIAGYGGTFMEYEDSLMSVDEGFDKAW
ncbi:MAG: hypothetical protein M3397_01550 [Actinomycetota bacterium]|jgi:hypothetical protein|nr:hypothetical protein [Rubrobacter sp.]MDQ3236992.1 hypothetical protein [Actinomycetota bacterium]MDQ3566750.1 hypothetical protein [Actinomycetota bacterium]